MNPTYIFRLLLMLMLFFSSVTIAQSLSRQTLCSTGGSNTINGVLVSQTVGQPYYTGASYGGGISYRPGFQQPAIGADVNMAVRLDLSIFPNPVFDQLNIESPQAITNAVIRVIDIRGVMIYSNHVSSFKTFRIDCQNWANGTYLISVSSGKSTYLSNIIVTHY